MGNEFQDRFTPESLWIGGTPRTDYPSLSSDLSVDVAIVGGGIVGLTAAMLLKESGARVAVLESHRIAQGVTARSTAKITLAHALIYRYLIDRFKGDQARRYAEANRWAIEFIASQVREKGISCDFKRTFACTYGLEEKDLEPIQREVEAAGQLGLPVTYRETLPLPFQIRGAVCFEDQAFFHPRKYLLALAEQIPGEGSYIFEETRVLDVQETNPCEVKTAVGKIKADQVIVATHFPILNRGFFFAKMTPTRSYLLAVKIEGEPPEGMYYSLENPYHTIRRHVTDSGDSLLLVGGENHETGHERDTRERYAGVESFARRHFNVKEILYRWSTQDNRPVDQIPFIGRHSLLSERLYVATGLRGWGISNGTAAGKILSDMIGGRSNPWRPVYDPNRFTPYLSKKFYTQNIHIGSTFIRDHLPQKKRPLSDLAPGEGEIVEREGKDVAAFVEQDGKLHVVSPFCSHMGCRVEWNHAEESWDCPCHGSRFDKEGKVIHAPATVDLPKEG